MLAPKNVVPLDGVVICGKRFMAADADSAFAVYDLDNVGCGVVWEAGNGYPYLHFRPAIQIPKRITDGFARYLFELDDERFADCKIDENDGELSISAHLRSSDPALIEPVVADTLKWIDTDFYRACVDYVAERMASAPMEPKAPTDLFDSLMR